MALTKEQLIQFITKEMPDDSIVDITFSVEEPTDNNSLIGTHFGSATHMIRNSRRTYKGAMEINYTYSA